FPAHVSCAFFACVVILLDLYSFPTRRSSDLINAVFIFGFTLTKFANDYFSSEDRLRSIESKQIESELNFLKAQINPHFLFNTLKDRKSTRLNSSHVKISYAVFCLKKKTTNNQ